MLEFNILYTLIIAVGVLALLPGTVSFLVWLERRLSAYMQDRVGPNRVGPFGLLQSFADVGKLFLKEDITPTHVDKVFYFLAPCVAVGTALLAFSVVPFGPSSPPPAPVPTVEIVDGKAIERDPAVVKQEFDKRQAEYRKDFTFAIAPGLDIGVLLIFAVGSLAVYGIVLGGWSANNKYSLLGSLRSTAQIISYEIPLGMSILGLVLFTGSLNLEKAIDWQANHGWFVLYQPLAFVLFMTAVFAECNRLPFDLPEAEQELVGGYHTEYSSFKFAMFFLGEYIHMITTSFLMAILFFGGWHFPGISNIDGILGIVLKFAVVSAKVAAFILVYMLVRWTIPRFRFDQLMSLAWKVMIPLSLLNLLCAMIVREFGLSPWFLTVMSCGLFFGAAWLGTRMPVKTAALT
ncbi:MAG: NADH-quinone oxidoreductase subunit NuoH [Planctomycetes bacterium]|nr:NADH-quinone oxidoreductase subunit NuoH [Planctomycetota bacterium]